MSGTDTTATHINGIDLAALGAVAAEVLSSEKPILATIRTEHEWTAGARVTGRGSTVDLFGATIDRAHHTLTSDLPPLLGGHDTAPAPSEVLLAALTGCVVSGLAEQAAFEGVELGTVTVSADASIDIRGAFGVEGAAVAPASITLTMTIDGAADAEVLESLAQSALAASPTAAAIAQPVPVHLEVRVR